MTQLWNRKKNPAALNWTEWSALLKKNPALLQNEAKLSSRSFHLISMKGYTVYCVSSQLCLCWHRSQMQCDVDHGDQTTELVSTSVATRSTHRVSLKMKINCCIFSLQFLPLHHVAVQGYNFFDSVTLTLIGCTGHCAISIFCSHRKETAPMEKVKRCSNLFFLLHKNNFLSLSQVLEIELFFAKCVFALYGHKPP